MTATEIKGARSRLRAPRDASRRAGQRGAAAAEAAAVLPLAFAVVVAIVWLLSLAATHVRVVDAAREAARVAARADSTQAAVEAGGKVAPEGASIAIAQSGTDVIARVRARVRGPGGLLAFLPSPTVEAEAVSVREDL